MSNSLQVSAVPPPPPVLRSLAETHTAQLRSKTTLAKRCNIDEYTWADAWPELQTACHLAKVCTYSPPKGCKYKNIPSILQQGPTCGLTALSMLLGGCPTPMELLSIAKQQNYTNNGEMFSAKNLHKLICDTVAGMAANVPPIECQLFEGRLNCAKVRDCLLDGACIFVAYDTDFNNAPCLKFGHKAHWALIIGYLIDERDEFFVVARHGKSKNLAIWSLKSLSASNSNLEEFSQPVGYRNLNFLLPEEGIGGPMGLKEQAIIVHGASDELIVDRKLKTEVNYVISCSSI